uniref:F-actin monooxygenase n=1 Tax=Astyanax mexicanus TaxID=7994 RepID=A0A8B9L4W1_ASTMX
MGDGQQEAAVGECRPHALFDSFVQASTCRETLRAFQELCGELQLQPGGKALFYHTLRSRLHYWKAKALWAKLDKRASQREYQRGRACTNTTCLIIGAGPCGLRTAIELSFLGARVVLVEKRDAFSRNNVLHLWPFTIQDLRGLGAKKFYGKFCAGAIDHISIRQLQLMLLKVALLLGVEVHVNVEFRSLREPPENQEKRSVGWRAEVRPTTHAVSELQFDVVIGADGRRNTLPGNIRYIELWKKCRDHFSIDLENIVYYKDDTHYFVMTAKKQSLLEKGVILRDYADTEMLLSRGNVDQNALLAYARQAADFSTNHQLPTLDFAINHYGQPDVAMFDFTCMYASENAALVRQRRGHSLLVALVGDSLLEPFWPMGTGIARGFLAAMDAGWMVRSWGMGASPLEVLAERESVYRLLPQTTPENVSKNYSQYSLDPSTRYPNINTQLISPAQVSYLLLNRQDSTARSNKLLGWCQEQTEGYRSVCVTDLTTSWRNGLALCALIHRYRPDLIDFDGLEESEAELNWQLGLEIAERELGVSPIMTIQELSMLEESDSLCMVMYLSQLHDLLKDTVPLSGEDLSPEERAALLSSTKSPMCLLNRLGQSLSRKRNPKDKKEKDADGVGKRRRTSQAGLSEDEEGQKDHRDDHAQAVSPGSETGTAVGGNQSRVRSMATQLLAKFEENAPSPSVAAIRRQGSQRKEFPVSMGGSDVCYFCGRRVYVMERLSAEGKFFHRSCFQCDHCSSTLRLSNYAYDQLQGKFYCKQHYSYRLAGLAQRKRPAPTPAPLPGKYSLQTPPVPPPTPLCVDTATPPDNWSSSTPPDLAAKLAKRLCGTPERIELENYRPCLQEQGSPLEEVPEEMLAQHNLSLSKGSEEQSSSSESELEDQGEVSWRRSKEPQATTNGVRESERRAEQKGEEEEDDEKEQGEEEEEEEVSEEEEEDVGNYEESSDDCFYTNVTFSTLLFSRFPESSDEHPDEPEVKPCSDRRGKNSCELQIERIEHCVPHKDCSSPSEYLHADVGVYTYTPTSDLPVTPEDSLSKRTEVIEEFWMKSAEIRKSLGLTPMSRDLTNTFYTSNIHTPSLYTTASDSPSHTPHKYNSIAGELNITLEGHVMEDRVASASNHVSRIIGNNHRDLAPESGLLTPPCSPPVARCYRLAAEPAVEREILLNSGISHPSMLQKDRLQKKGMVSVQRLPPDEVEVLCADEAHPYANATPVDATNQLPSRSSLMDQHKTSSFPNISSAPAPEHAGKDKREGRRTLTEGPLQVGGAEVWLRRPEAGKSGAEEKEKKRSSLFSPRKSRKGGDTQQETTKHKSLWKSVFSGYKKEKKRKEAAALAATLPSGADHESRRRMPSLESSCPTEVVGVWVVFPDPSSISLSSTLFQKTGAEEELDAKLTRRVQRAARRQAKQEELRRLHRAQIIQRQLEQVEVKQRQLEEKGIAVEKALRGEADYWEDSSISDLLDVHLGGMGKKDDPSLMQQWFKLVQEKNALVRYESELMIFARELELEDRQSRLQQELRERMAVDDHLKGEDELEEEKCILGEMLDVVEQRDALVALLEEQRVREREEDSDLEAVMLSKGFNMHWA